MASGGGPVLRVEGGARLRGALRAADAQLGDLRGLHAQVARTVETAARGAVPVRSGALRGSLRSSGTATAATVRAGGARLPYAKVIHWGWPAHHIAPSMFLVDPAHTTEPVWSQLYLRRVDAILADVARKADGHGA